YRIKLAVSSKDLPHIQLRDTVQVIPEKHTVAITGTVYRKSLVPIGTSGLYPVEIDIPTAVPIGTYCQVKFQAPISAIAMDPPVGERDESMPPMDGTTE